MTDVVLFGIGSALVPEYVETCRRLGYRIVAAVKNRAGPVYLADETKIVDVRAVVASPLSGALCVCPMFRPANRRAAADEAMALGFTFARALIDPTAIVASTTAIGGGSYLNAGCIIGADSTLGEHVLVNRGVTIGHHATLGAFVSLGPSAVLAGCVTVGAGAMIGAGAVVLPLVEIGPNAVIGAGAVVVGDVPAGATVFGNPGRVVQTVS
ncbi:MAG: acetyltransferase [Candidatus Eremiobacteraeota bacterium]|nr:acetyltransferase [Candidatus Eremiobacteraeota bacterium]